jgi:hypothetical protein
MRLRSCVTPWRAFTYARPAAAAGRANGRTALVEYVSKQWWCLVVSEAYTPDIDRIALLVYSAANTTQHNNTSK